MLRKLPQMHLKLLQKKQFKKQHKQLVISMIIKLLIVLLEPQKICHRILQRQLKVKQKYLEKDIHLQEKDRKLSMI